MSPPSRQPSRLAAARTPRTTPVRLKRPSSRNVENLINDGADVVVILAQNTEAILPAVEAALAENIPVIAYDRLIESPDVLYTSFDNVRVGEMQAEAVLDVVSEGNFVVIKGNGDDANSDFLRQGMVNAGIPDVG